MGFWRFLDERRLSELSELVPAYDHRLGWVAGLLAVFAGFALFPALARVRSARTDVSRRAWHLGGAVTMSIGFWGTQNMALLGFDLPASYYYDPVIGFASLLPAIAGCAAAILALATPAPSAGRLHLGAASLALGIGAMHYALMEAIKGDVVIAYDAGLFLLSFALPYGVALLALYASRDIDRNDRQLWLRWTAGSFLLGVAVLGNHFSAMAGSHFHDDPAIISSGLSTLPVHMIPLIGGCVLFLVTVFWIGSVIDGRLGEASQALRSSEARNRAVIETMLDAHMITDRQGVIRSVNPAAEEVFGWTAGEIVGKSVSMLINEGRAPATGDRSGRDTRAAAMPLNRRRWVYADGGRRKDGTRFPVELAVSPFHVDGEQYFSCAVRDLTDSWAAEARLRRLAAAIDQAGEAICIIDAGHRIQYVNPAYERQTGYSLDEVMGRQPSRGASGDDVYSELWSTVGQGRTWTGQVRARRRDGSLYDEELTITPVLDSKGVISAYVAVTRDITRRLEVDIERRRLAEALQHCTDSIEILDSQGRIVYVNAAFEASSGQKLANIRGSRPEALTDFSAAEDSYQDMLRTAYRGGRPWSGTLKSVSPDGSLSEEDVTVSPMRDDRGQITGYVVVKRDTTDRRRLEAQAEQKQKLESIAHMADGIAHELGTPIRSLDDHLRFLRDSFGHLDRLLDELTELARNPVPVTPAALAAFMQSADVDFLRREITRALDQSAESAQRMMGVVRAMRDMSQSRPEQVDMDLNQAIQSTITITTSEWRPVAEIRTDLDASLPPLRCAPGEISLVMLSLLLSCAQGIAAANRTRLRGKGVITVTTRRMNDWAEIRIGGSGRGLTREEREAMFRADGAERSDNQGQSMALAHKVIVAKHHGTIAVESDAGLGVMFVVRLPIERDGSRSAHVAA